MNKKIILTIFLLFLLGCQGWPGRARLAQFKDSPASTLILSREAFIKATDTHLSSVYWTNKDYLSVTGSAPDIEWNIPSIPRSPIAVRIPELSIVSRPEDVFTLHSKVSPDGKYFISFSEENGWGISSLTDLIESGKNTLVYSLPVEFRDGVFEWSRDSQNLAHLFVDSQKSGITLQIYNLPTHTVRTVFEYVENISDTDLDDGIGGASWSADGKRLAFSVQYTPDIGKNHRNAQLDLFVYNIEQNKLVKATSMSDVSEYFPSWYPDTNILMFVTGDGSTSLTSGKLSFLANDGECIRTLPGYEGISYPSWSPDGKQIAYLSSDGIEFLDVEKIIPPEYLSPDTLCQISDGSGE